MMNSFVSIIKKIKQFHHEHGFRALLTKLRMHSQLFLKNWYNKKIRKEISVAEILTAAFPHATPIAPFKINQNHFRLNLVLDGLKKQDFFGGTGTSLILATLFANRYEMPLRIISRKSENRPDQYFRFLKLQNIKSPQKVEFYSDYDREISWKRQRLETSEKDIYLTTSWWTQEAIKEVNFRPTYFHLAQETPNQSGDSFFRYTLALNDPKVKLISNLKISHPNTCHFNPAFPDSLYTPSPFAFTEKSKYKLFFYARPDKPISMFHTGLKLIDDALSYGVLLKSEWDIYLAGAPLSSLTFSSGIKPKLLGKLDWDDYLHFIKTIDLGVCLWDSPHPNYSALDVAAVGGVVLTNSLEASKKSSNVVHSPLNDLMKQLKEAIVLSKNLKQRKDNFRNNEISGSWEKTFEETLHYMDMYK